MRIRFGFKWKVISFVLISHTGKGISGIDSPSIFTSVKMLFTPVWKIIYTDSNHLSFEMFAKLINDIRLDLVIGY